MSLLRFGSRHFVTLLSATLLLSACKSVPLTGRSQLSLVSPSEINAMSFQQYDQVIRESTLSTNTQQVNMIKRVGHNIQIAVEKYLRDAGHSEVLEGFQWEFNLIQSDQVNAWCMPGGKVAFYTGILPICQDETGVAVVMGHEVAHAIARHGAERMSQQMLAQYGQMALSIAVMNEDPAMQEIYMSAFGLGAQYGALLPFSRKHESEADEMGLVFMAMAGYDPREAPEFWKRMAAAGGGSVPEFMSTHPSDDRRIRDLQAQIPKALKYYQPDL
jgi:predicted Zn-dependent protease